jgi:hypothetical protein
VNGHQRTHPCAPGYRLLPMLGVALGLAGRPAAAQLPSRLTDSEFRTLMSMSEPGGLFVVANNFTSNEMVLSEMVANLTVAHDTGGVYLGVGPEQNFSYIAAVRPRMAFLVDIRRQAIVQHGRLTRTHGIVLDATDAAFLRLVYASFVALGPRLRDEPGAADSVGYRLAASWSSDVLPLVVMVHDGTSGAPVPAFVRYAASTAAFGGRDPADASGRYQLPPYPVGSTLRLTVNAYGYDTLHVENVRPDRARPVITLSLVRGSACLVDSAAGGRVCRQPLPRGGGAAGSAGRGARGRGSMASMGRIGTVPPGANVGAQGEAYYDGRNFAALTASVDLDGTPRSFLATESAFRAVKSLHDRNLIIPVVADFAGPSGIRAIGSYIRDRGAAVSVFYTSTVLDYLWLDQRARRFFENAATLPVSATSVILDVNNRRCAMRGWIAAGLQAQTQTDHFQRLRTSGVCSR